MTAEQKAKFYCTTMSQRTIHVGVLIDSLFYKFRVGTASEVLDALNCATKHIRNDQLNVTFSILSIGESYSENILKKVDGMEVLLGNPRAIAEYMKHLPKSVKWIQSLLAGVDPIYHALGKGTKQDDLQFMVSRMQGCYGPSVAEYVVAAIISLERDFKKLFVGQLNKKWLTPDNASRCFRFRRLNVLTLGVLGAGDIGMLIASHAKSLGMTVYAIKRTPPSDEQQDILDQYFTLNELDSFLACCDYLCNVLPSTSLTKDLLSGDQLKVCSEKKPGFINVGRGDVIDENSLINALNQRWISSAFLDVVETEPLSPSSRLWSMENVTITPHVSGLTDPNPCLKVFAKNLERYVKGEKLLGTFDWENGY